MTIPARLTNSVRAGSSGWQLECWAFAKEKKRFEVEGFSDQHRRFLDEIRAAYEYELDWQETKVIFIPPRPKSGSISAMA